MDTGILTRLLTIFMRVFTAGTAHVLPEAMWLLQVLATIEIAFIGMWWMYSHDHSMGVFVAKIFGFGVLSFLIQHWPDLTKTLIRSFMVVGLKAGGEGITEQDMSDPSNIALFGMSVTAVIFSHLKEYAGLDAIKNLPEILFSGFAAMAVVLTYFTLAIWIFVALLEFYAMASVTVILIPFAAFSKTAFLAEKAIAVIFASGVRVLVLSFITGATLPIMVTLQTGLNPTFNDVMVLLLGSMALCALAWRADKLSQSLLHGAPQLTAHDVQQVVHNTISTLTTIGGAGAALRASTQMAATRIGAAFKR